VFFNGALIKKNEFALGVQSKGNEISFEFSIRDVNLQFYDKREKKFVFELICEVSGSQKEHKSRFEI
jgi:hypothetical protein